MQVHDARRVRKAAEALAAAVAEIDLGSMQPRCTRSSLRWANGSSARGAR